jgi:hypothetical protein
MLRWIVLVLVVIALTAVATVLTQYAPNADTAKVPVVTITKGPHGKVEVPEPLVYNFGTMPQRSEGKHSWEFKNVGDADLELWLESSTCSCTIAKFKADEGRGKKTVLIKPNTSTTIDLEWQTKLFPPDYTKGATIGTNDPARPSVALSVTGKVYPPVILVPADLVAFNTVSNEQINEAKIAVFSMDRPETKITQMTTSRPEFLVPKSRPLTADECKQLKAKAGYEVTLTMKPGLPLGRFREDLAIVTDHPLNSDLKLPVTGVVTGPISFIPESVRMPSVSSSEGATRDVTILVRDEKATEFEVAYAPKKIQVKITPDPTATQKGRYRMTVIVPPGTSAGPVQDDIILRTDHPKATELKIPVNVLISNSGSR